MEQDVVEGGALALPVQHGCVANGREPAKLGAVFALTNCMLCRLLKYGLSEPVFL